MNEGGLMLLCRSAFYNGGKKMQPLGATAPS